MTYEQLRQYAAPHIRKGSELPTNAFVLLHQLHIPYGDQERCEEDYGGRMTPLYNHPAFLAITNKEKIIYFNTTAKYWNFYIFHEIAHYLLGHEDDSPQNEMDANMLACILAAPIENLPTYLKTARDLSSLCKIPIDKAEEYWQEIGVNFSKPHKKLLITGLILLVALITIFISAIFNSPAIYNEDNFDYSQQITTSTDNTIYYKTSSGTHYHLKDCKHIKYKNNIIDISKDEIIKLNLEPCNECIK